MKSNFPLRGLLLALAAVTAATLAPAYDLIRGPGGARVTWNNGTIPLVIRMPQTPTFQDGTNYATSVQSAIAAWNAQLANVQLSSQIVAPGAAADNGLNEIVLASQIYGDEFTPPEDFGPNVLAVTLSYRSGSPRGDGSYQRLESDILFNSGIEFGWDSYRGNEQYPVDVRRVAIHELGHLLGLDHPDEANQAVTAIMNSRVSDTDALQTDDITGAQFLYGRPGGFTAPTNNHFANATPITLVNNGAQVSGSSIGANKEAGEPNHAPDEPGGASVWWRWTATANGTLTVTTAGSHFDTLLAAYTGGSVNSLTQLAANDDVQNGVVRTSTVTSSVTGGTTYYFAVDGWDGEWGSIWLNFSFTPNAVAPTITSQPGNQSVTVGQNAQFTTSASGTPAPAYQWQRLPNGGSTWSNLSNSGGYSGVNTATLTVIGASLDMNGDRFRCLVSNSAGSVPSAEATLQVTPATPPTIVTQPLDVTANAGQSVQFSVGVTGSAPLTYRWQTASLGSDYWGELFDDGSTYSGTSTATLTLPSVQTWRTGSRFRCVVTNSAGTATSSPATVTVPNSPPLVAFSSYDPNFEVDLGGSITIAPALAGSTPMTFMWRRWNTTVGSNSPTLTITDATPNDQNYYFLHVSNDYGTASINFRVTVRSAPRITQQPADRLVNDGHPAHFSFQVTSYTQPTYRWQRLRTGNSEWEDISGPVYFTTGNSLAIEQVSLADSGDRFRCLITNPMGTTVTETVTLTVQPSFPTVSLTLPQTTIVRGSTVTLQPTVGGTGPHTYQWRRGGIDLPGATEAVLTIPDFQAENAGEYTLWVTNVRGSSFSSLTLQLESLPKILRGPFSRTVSAGGEVTLRVEAQGSVSPLTYQWQRNGVPLPGATGAALTLANIQSADLGHYSVVVSNPTGSVETAPASIVFAGPTFVSRPMTRIVRAGQSLTIDATAQGSGAVTYSWRRNRKVLPGQNSATLSIAQAGLRDGGYYEVFATDSVGVTRTVFYVHIAPATGRVQASLGWSYYGEKTVPAGLSDAVGIAAGANTSLAIKPDRTVAMWGLLANYATVPAGLTNVVAVDCCNEAAIALKGDGTLTAWGTGGSLQHDLPPGLSGVVAVAVGDTIALALKADGTVTAWGSFLSAQAKQQMAEISDAVAVAGGRFHGMVLRSDGSVVSWGDGSPAAGNFPIGVPTTDVVAIATGWHHGLALKLDGTVQGWGSAVTTPFATGDGVALTASSGNTLNFLLGGSGRLTGQGYNAGIPANLGLTYAVSAGSDYALFLDDPNLVPPTITTQPGSLQRLTGQSASFTIQATGGAGITYRWQSAPANSETWTDLANSATISGATTRTLTVANLALEQNALRFRCVATNDAGFAVSAAATLTVTLGPPVIATQPSGQLAAAGGTVTLSVVAQGTGPFSYQWVRNGQDVPGATGATLALSNLSYAQSGPYHVRITGPGGSVTSHQAFVNLIELPEIVAHPVGATFIAGTSPTLRVVANSMVDVTYQWFRNGTPIPGATLQQLTLTNLTSAQAGDYHVVVTNPAGSSDSRSTSVIVLPEHGVLSVAAGGSHNLFLRTDGRLFGMGRTSQGALPPAFGHFSYQGWDVPVLIDENVVQMAAGAAHTVWLKQDGTLWAQGLSTSYRDGITNDNSTPIQIAAEVAQVSAGEYHTHFIRRDGTLWAVGRNFEGQLGDGTTIAPTAPVQVADGVVAVAGGNKHSLMLKSDGTLWATGDGARGALGLGDFAPRLAWTQVASGVKAIAAGRAHSLFVKNDDTLWSMGANDYGQLGIGSRLDTAVPTQVATSVAVIAAGGEASAFALTNGTLWAMGFNQGTYGNGSTVLSDVPVQVSSANVFSVGITTGSMLHSRSDGSVWASGPNSNRELGLGNGVFDIVTAARVTGGDWSAPAAPTSLVASDDVYSDSVRLSWNAPFGWRRFEVWRNTSNDPATATMLALRVNLTYFADTTATPGVTYYYWVKAANPRGVSAFSQGDSGRVSLGTLPVIVTPPASQTVQVGTSVTLTATVSGTLPLGYQWHFNGEPIAGATGASYTIPHLLAEHAGDYTITATNIAGSATSPSATLSVTGPAAVVQVATGQVHSLMVRSDGTLWTTGGNALGQLGDGTTESRSTPVQVATGVIRAYAGRLHSFYLQGDGSLWAMGYNGSGQLGDGTNTSRSTPVLVMTDVVKVATQDTATLFLKRDGSLWASGYGTWVSQTVFSTTATPVQIMEGVRDMAIGAEHMAVVMINGELRTAGRNYIGELGDGTTISRATFQTVMEGVVAVSAGARHTAALRFDGTLWAFGGNDYGQLGDGIHTSHPTPVLITTDVQGVDCGYNRTFFWKQDGSLWRMGSGLSTSGFSSSYLTPTQLSPVAVAVSAFWSHMLQALPNGILLAAGNNSAGQLGGGSIYGEWSPIIVHTGLFSRPEAVGNLSASDATIPGAVRILWDGVPGAAGYEVWRGTSSAPVTLLARVSDPYHYDINAPQGGTHYWVRAINPAGPSDFGASDAGAPEAVPVPLIVAPPVGARSFVGLNATLTVVAEGEGTLRYQWYRNGVEIEGATQSTLTLANLQLSDDGVYTVRVSNLAGHVESTPATLRVTLPEGVLHVAAGREHSLFLRTDGSLWGMGRSSIGQVAAPPDDGRIRAPRLIATDVVAMAAGWWHTLYVTSDGNLWAMGSNNSGQLGDGTTTNRTAPVMIATDVAAVAAGAEHSLFIRKDGSLWGMGGIGWGQLGTGGLAAPRSPVRLLERVNAIAAGERHSVALKDDGTVWTAGYHSYGALGQGFNSASGWGQAASGATAVAAGDNHTHFLKSDGTVWAMGYNGNGQLGNGTNQGDQGFAGVFTPIQIGTGFSGVAAGGNTSFLTKSNGTVWATGNNAGLYGNGTTTNSATPIQVFDGNAYAVSTGGTHLLIAASDGSLRTAGSNFWGQLGDGTVIDRSSAVTVAMGSLVAPAAPTAVSAYGDFSGSGVRVTWRAPVGWRRFEVWRGTSADFSQATMIVQRVSLPTYLDTTAQPGVQYHYWVKAANPMGVSAPSASDTGALNETPVPQIDTQPLSQTAAAGSDVSLTVQATGTAPLSYQWRKDGQEIPGATAATLLLADVTIAAAGDYDVVVSNAAGSVTSAVATLSVEKLSQMITFPVISDQYIGPGFISITQATATSGLPVSYSVVSGPALLSNSGNALVPTGTGSVTVRATQAGDATYAPAQPVERTFSILPPRNDAFAEAHLVTGGNVVAFGDTTWATRQSGEPEHVPGTAGTASLWWKWVAPYSNGADVQITTVGSEFDTVLAVYTGSSLESLTLVAANDDRAAGDPLSSVSFWTPSGTTYYIAIDGKNDAKGPARLNIGAIPSSGTAPVFTLQPQSVSVVAGNTATFTINYTGQFPTTLFWQRRAAGTDTWVYVSTSDSFYFSGTGVALTIRPTAAMNGDQFRCVASNNLGTTYSNAALVTVTETLDSWSHEHFTAEELLDPAISGPNADPDGDGFANLLEYALGLDPRAAATDGLPEIGVVATDLAYTYTRPVGRSELTYSVQFSTNLTSWTSEGVTHELVSTVDGVETWRGRVPLSTGANLFLRVRVERP